VPAAVPDDVTVDLHDAQQVLGLLELVHHFHLLRARTFVTRARIPVPPYRV